VSWLADYFPAPGLQVSQNPRRREECSPLVLYRNPRSPIPARGTSIRGISTRADGDRIASLRDKLIELAPQLAAGTLHNVQTAPRLDLETAAELLGISVDEVRDLAHTGQICQTWEVHLDGSREQVVRAIDVIAMLSRGASPIRVSTR
jgi:hypothetical protein